MNYEKILLRDDHKVKLKVSLHIDHRDTYWNVEIYTCAKGKRTWVNPHSNDDYSWRRLDMKGRDEYKLQKQLLHVTIQEISDAKKELISRIPY